VSSENPRAGISIGTVVVVVVVVGLGVLFLAPFVDGTFSSEVARLSNPDVTIETTFSSDGTSGTFTATGAPICSAGDVTRKDSGTSATYSWYEDEYLCSGGKNAFILRGELPLDPDAVGGGESLPGTWLIASGRDDYGDLKGDGTSKVTLGPPRTDSYTGTATYGG
jgi:hypothetical protein